MKITVSATYVNGAFTPNKRLSVSEGEEVTLRVGSPAPSPAEARRALKASAGAWKGKHDPDALIRMIYDARLEGAAIRDREVAL